MKQLIALATLFTANAVALTGAPADGTPAGERQAIESRLDQYESRFNQADAEAVSRLFAQDATYYGPLGQIFEGREAVRQRYQGTLEAGFRDMKVDTLEIRVFGDTAYDIARYTILDPGGKPLTGYHLAILERKDGEWLVQRTLVNAKMSAPAGN